MPAALERLCRCGARITGPCPVCRPKADRARVSFRERGYDSRWTAYSVRRRQRYPLCVLCAAVDLVTPVAVTDHIEPHRGDRVKLMDPENHQSLCGRCNRVKGMAREGGFGHAANQTASRHLPAQDGWVLYGVSLHSAPVVHAFRAGPRASASPPVEWLSNVLKLADRAVGRRPVAPQLRAGVGEVKS